MADRQITRDEALLWLNDRVGRTASVYVVIDVGTYSNRVLCCEGVLRHWAVSGQAEGLAPGSRDDIVGLYLLTGSGGGGGDSLDLEDLGERELLIRTHDVAAAAAGLERATVEQLVIALADDVELQILFRDPGPDTDS